MTTYDVTAPDSIAACDQHLTMLLREAIQPLSEGANVTLPAQISRLDTPDPMYKCTCLEPATWFVRRLLAGKRLHRVIAVLDADETFARYHDTEQTRQVAQGAINAVLS